MNTEQNDIDELISRCLAGEAAPGDEQRLAAWIASSDENAQHYQKAKRIFALADNHYHSQQKVPAVDLNLEWNRFLKNSGTKTDNVRQLQPVNSWLRVAAAVLLLVASGFVINYFITSTRVVEIETVAHTQSVTLPDGSIVTLNQNSKLSYSKSFNEKQRSVRLQGEAFFEIAHDGNKPFVISLDEGTVEVLGTSFNVRDYANNNLEVVVATGTVKFSVPGAKQDVTLQAGDRGIFNRTAKTLTHQTNSDVNFMAWKTRTLMFSETSLREVVETINRTYQTNITISALVPDTCQVTVTFDQQSLDAVLAVLKSTLNLTYRTQNGQIEIIEAGC